MIATAISCAVRGLFGVPVTVEADVANGLPGFTVVGLTDRAIQESKERVRGAVRNAGLKFPEHKVTVNLAPAEFPKEGTVFDLAIAIAVLRTQGVVPASDSAFLGELALDGSVRPVAGVLPMVRCLRDAGVSRVVVPTQNLTEAKMVNGIEVLGSPSLGRLIEYLQGGVLPSVEPAERLAEGVETAVDIAQIKGQALAKRALEIAAAGGHNILLVGPPGAGKTMLARALPSLVPDLTDEEALDVAATFSVRGMFSDRNCLSRRPPFRSPHHSISRAGLVGGGSGIASPGEISLAHNGVLFLDEVYEFPRTHLEALRQPLEERTVSIARSKAAVTFPANFMLVAAANPCPCGYLGDAKRACQCSPHQLQLYATRLSGPIRDRIDMVVNVSRQDYHAVFGKEVLQSEGSAVVRERVKQARASQLARSQVLNSRLPGEGLKTGCAVTDRAETLLAKAGDAMQLSARGFARTIRLSRTIADLAGKSAVEEAEVAEALHLRGDGVLP